MLTFPEHLILLLLHLRWLPAVIKFTLEVQDTIQKTNRLKVKHSMNIPIYMVASNLTLVPIAISYQRWPPACYFDADLSSKMAVVVD